MDPPDTQAPFTQIPWIARLINQQPNIIWCVPPSRSPKSTFEDSLFAVVLKTPRTIRNCMAFYTKPALDTDHADEVNVVMTLGDGLNGHPAILHGGITATVCDEAMGMYQGINVERAHAAKGFAEGGRDMGTFTVELKVTYLRPVMTPGALVVSVKRVRKEGRKEWLRTEVKQWQGYGEDGDGEVVVCAVAEALFVQPKSKPKL